MAPFGPYNVNTVNTIYITDKYINIKPKKTG